MRATVTTKWEPDCDPDLSWIGEYSNTLEKGGIDREERGDMGRHEYRFFNPQPGLEEYVEQEYERMQAYNRGEWWMEGCVVTVSCGGVTASDSLWGIESDREENDTRTFERDIRREAFHHWREQVAELKQTWCS